MNFDEIAKRAGDAPYNAQQKWTELSQLLQFLEPRKPRNILEIGVYKGGTIMAWTSIAAPDATIVGVDLPGGDYGGGFTKDEVQLIKKLARHEQYIYLYAKNSQSRLTVSVIKQHAPFDFIFIDGDHSFKGVKSDYDNYLPMLADGGVMAFHDIVVHSNPDIEIFQLWKQIKLLHNSFEIIDPKFPTDHGQWGGIGVIIK